MTLHWEYYAKCRVLLVPYRDWSSINLPSLLSHNIPVFYTWMEKEVNNVQFLQLDPNLLLTYQSAEAASGLTYPDFLPNDIPLWQQNFKHLADYMEFLEKIKSPRVKGDHINSFKDSPCCSVTDFRGRKRQEIKEKTVLKAYSFGFAAWIVDAGNKRN